MAITTLHFRHPAIKTTKKKSKKEEKRNNTQYPKPQYPIPLFLLWATTHSPLQDRGPNPTNTPRNPRPPLLPPRPKSPSSSIINRHTIPLPPQHLKLFCNPNTATSLSNRFVIDISPITMLASQGVESHWRHFING